MSNLTIKHAGTTQTATAGTEKKGGTIVRVTPTLDTSAISADNVVFFNATEVSNAVSNRGGVSRLLGFTLLNEDDVTHNFDVIFMQVSSNLGTINNAVGSGSLWTNALAKAAKVIGIVKVDMSDNEVDLINNKMFSTFKGGAATDADSGNHFPMLLQAESNSTSIYVAGVSRNGNTASVTTAADDYEFAFHIEYL